ncbi:MAG: hypothetical protein Q4B22_12165 [Eubacteriales bacterium]|nr:hypothetical protein [Eubacteriales bacterium]
MVRGRKISEENLEQQIEKAQEKVIRTKAAYENAVSDLQKILDKRDAKRKDDLWNAVISSKKSYEEILELIKGDADLSEES